MKDARLEQLKSKYNIRDVAAKLGHHIPEHGSTVAIRCFNAAGHPNGDRNPSLVLKPDRNSYECKGCGIYGDVVSFVQGAKGISFKDAVTYLDPSYYTSGTAREESAGVDGHDYWKSRGITEQTAQKFGLVLTKDSLAIPLGNGKTKHRNFSGKPKYKNPPSDSLPLFKAGEPRHEAVCVTEGELDAILLHQETGGAAWSTTAGAQTFKPEWLPAFDGIKRIYLCYDTDQQGNDGVLVAARALGPERCYKVILPEGKDITEYFVKYGHTAKEFQVLLRQAVCVADIFASREDGVLDFASMASEAISRRRQRQESLTFGIPRMDTGPGQIDMPPGLILIAAAQGTGKTWMHLYLSKIFFLKHHKKSLILTLEMTGEALKERVLQSWSELTRNEYERGEPTELAVDMLQTSQLRIREFGIKDSQKATPAELDKILRDSYKDGYRVFHIDHIHQIPGMNDINTEKQVSEQWINVMRAFLAEHPDAWIFAYTQVTKSAAKGTITKEGIRYAVRFVDVCDMMFTLNRKPDRDTDWYKLTSEHDKDDELSQRAVRVFLAKNRLTDVPAGERGWIVYLDRTGNFVEKLDSDVMPAQPRVAAEPLQLPQTQPMNFPSKSKQTIKHGSPEWMRLLGRHIEPRGEAVNL